MSKLILLRHGQSVWNQYNLFTGWVDIPLSTKGINESFIAGEMIQNIPIDVIFVSSLMRAQMTAFLAMTRHNGKKIPLLLHNKSPENNWTEHNADPEMLIPVYTASQLNERMYGVLQGLNKQEVMDKYGAEQVHQWRRSYDAAPPGGESLKMTAERAIPYFHGSIVPFLQSNKNILISAHGNSLRALVMFIEGLDQVEVLNLEINTGELRIYEYEDNVFKRT
ncbi:MAG: 2,3-bisphosphoglycerate-dependent phosphoglycerate mutase [Chlamydiae bacterium]|nr:2,3-bisphosphoglycerate-dependent phosphoglycerate mutase [Chlamydiota bacterium]